MITCICLTYGRISFLEEAVQMFLNQDYKGERELLIFNTFKRQRLFGEFENVRIVNCDERPSNLGSCRNAAINLARDGLLIVYDDDDCYTNDHISNFANHYEEGVDWIWHDRQFYMEAYKLRQIVKGSCNSLAFTKAAWQKVGGYPERNVGEDRDFVSKLTQQCNGKKVQLKDRELSLLYHWAQGVYHTSGLSDDQKGIPSAHDRIAAYTEDLARKGIIPTGDITLQPKLTHDYVKMRNDFIADREAIALKKKSVCFVQLGRFGDLVNILPLCLHCHNNYAKPYLMVSREFASILDGVSYVEPYVVDIPFDTLQPALELARKTFTHVIQTQIWARDYQCDRQTDAYNKESWRQAGFLDKWDDQEWLPEFDLRDMARELAIKNKSSNGSPMLLVNLTRSFSSPFQHGEWLLNRIRERWSSTFNIVDISNSNFERVYDLLGLMDAAHGIISIDSVQLHLAGATMTPLLAITNPVPWLGSAIRAKTTVVYHETYDTVKENWEDLDSVIKGLLDE